MGCSGEGGRGVDCHVSTQGMGNLDQCCHLSAGVYIIQYIDVYIIEASSLRCKYSMKLVLGN